MPEFTAQDFVAKWKRVTSRENQTYSLELANNKLDDLVFTTYGWKSKLYDEEILEMAGK